MWNSCTDCAWQTSQMREELVRSLPLLQANLAALSEQRILGSPPERRSLADVLAFDRTRKKANRSPPPSARVKDSTKPLRS